MIRAHIILDNWTKHLGIYCVNSSVAQHQTKIVYCYDILLIYTHTNVLFKKEMITNSNTKNEFTKYSVAFA